MRASVTTRYQIFCRLGQNSRAAVRTLVYPRPATPRISAHRIRSMIHTGNLGPIRSYRSSQTGLTMSAGLRARAAKGSEPAKVFVSGDIVFPLKAILRSTNTRLKSCARSWKRCKTAAPTSWGTSISTRGCTAVCFPVFVRSNMQISSARDSCNDGSGRVYLDLTFISLLQRIEPAPETALPESIVENLRRLSPRDGRSTDRRNTLASPSRPSSESLK